MIPHNQPTLGEEEEQAVLRVLRSKWVAQGPEVESFETEFCEFQDIPKGNAIAVSSGSAALFLALWALNSKGKVIAYPSYVCSAVRNAVMLIDGHEKLVDNAPNSPNINTLELGTKNSDILIIPHTYGIPLDLSHLKSEKIVEDCCQSIGAKVNGKKVGLQGDIGIFSFHATKLMTSGGQGGMIISSNKSLIDDIRNFRDYGPQDEKMRFNFQLSDIQAAIGREQLKKLPNFLKRREEIFLKYKKAGLDLLDISPNDKEKLEPVRFRAILRTKNPQKIIKSLKSANIRSTILIDESGLLGKSTMYPNASNIARNSVSLPIYPTLSNENIEKIISCVI